MKINLNKFAELEAGWIKTDNIQTINLAVDFIRFVVFNNAEDSNLGITKGHELATAALKDLGIIEDEN